MVPKSGEPATGYLHAIVKELKNTNRIVCDQFDSIDTTSRYDGGVGHQLLVSYHILNGICAMLSS